MPRPIQERQQRILDLVELEGRVSSRELAVRLGVSPVTVRRDVEELAENGLLQRTHGYVSRAGERRISRPTSRRSIGLILPHSNYYYYSIISGARAAAAATGTRLVLGVSDYSPDMERMQADRLVAKGLDGLVIAPTPEFSTGRLRVDQEVWLGSLPVPVVLVERSANLGGPAAQLDSVSSAHAVGAATGVRHLVDLGHRRIVALMISGPNTTAVRSGLLAAAEAARFDPVELIDEGVPGSEDARQPLLDAVSRGATALFIHNDQLATRALLWLESAGLEVPRDVSVLCYDDVIAGVAGIPLTALAPPKHLIGRRALERVLQVCELRSGGSPHTGEHVELLPRLNVRESTAAVPRGPAPSFEPRPRTK